MKKKLASVVFMVMAAVFALTATGCYFTDDSVLDRIADLEAQIAMLEQANNEVSQEYLQELEDLIARLREEADLGTSEVIADIVEENIASTVAIQVGLRMGLSTRTITGSGFFVEYGGYIATNSHVITPNAGYSVDSITVHTFDGSTGSATIIADIPDIDLAIIRSNKFGTVKPVKISDSVPRRGSRVIAIGSPSGIALKFSCTSGIVSATGRTESATGDDGTSYHQFCIQHDAPINPGNSGGALFNLAGEVIGMNTMGTRSAGDTVYESLGFATEMSALKCIQGGIGRAVLSTINYELPTLGVTVTDSILGEISPDGYSGNNVKVITRGSELLVGDIITTINGATINTRQDFYRALFSMDKGDTAEVVYRRGFTSRTASIVV